MAGKTMTATDQRINTASLGLYHYRKFLRWAFVESQSKAAFGRNVLVDRTDVNEALIDRGIDFYAKEYGMTVEELEGHVYRMDTQGLSISQIHAQLVAMAAAKGLNPSAPSTEGEDDE